jgi:sensor histidine kinase YesM
MNKRLSLFLHVAFWAFMFLSPLSFMRGQGLTLVQYLTSCMTPLLMMVIFYINFLWLTPRFFAAGKHRYFLLINLVLIVLLGVGLHYWTIFAHQMFGPVAHHRNHTPMPIDQVLFILRDIVTLGIFAAVATAIILAQRWEHHDKARREAEAARTDAELKTLRNQINPHFLLNTLNNIYALTAFDAPKAQEAIQELSKMLRHLLYDYEQPTVPLKDEVEFLQNYINLMKIRLPESVKVDYQLTIANSQLPVAPMIFISLVENAFKHGVSPTEPSFISIHIEADQQQITCDIRNSNHPKTASDRSGHGIGLKQVQRRLELAYPKRYTWQQGVSSDGKTYSSSITIQV